MPFIAASGYNGPDMFTGLVQRIGEVAEARRRGSGLSLTVRAPGLAPAEDPPALGESIAVNGACLTAAALTADGFTADVLEETLRCTMLGTLRAGDRVNLERALRLGDRLGGHLVSGHVDEVGRLISVRSAGDDFVYRFACSSAFARGTVRKGSVAVSGVSLTVTAVDDGAFEVSLIPTTLRDTVLGALRPGDPVNLEADLLGVYVRRALGRETTVSAEHWFAAGCAD